MTLTKSEHARRTIEKSLYLTLSTSTPDGIPWCSPLAFAVSADYKSFYWYSGPETRHSRNILANPKTAAVIYNTTLPEASDEIETTTLYMEGVSGIVADEHVEEALGLIFTRFKKFPDKPSRKPELFKGPDAPRKVYEFRANSFSMLMPGGDPRFDIYVDCREDITPPCSA